MVFTVGSRGLELVEVDAEDLFEVPLGLFFLPLLGRFSSLVVVVQRVIGQLEGKEDPEIPSLDFLLSLIHI